MSLIIESPATYLLEAQITYLEQHGVEDAACLPNELLSALYPEISVPANVKGVLAEISGIIHSKVSCQNAGAIDSEVFHLTLLLLSAINSRTAISEGAALFTDLGIIHANEDLLIQQPLHALSIENKEFIASVAWLIPMDLLVFTNLHERLSRLVRYLFEDNWDLGKAVRFYMGHELLVSSYLATILSHCDYKEANPEQAKLDAAFAANDEFIQKMQLVTGVKAWVNS